jgi:hypothetical protein
MSRWFTYAAAALLGTALALMPSFAPTVEEQHFGWAAVAEAEFVPPAFGWIEKPVQAGGEPVHHFGWTPDPQAVKDTLKKLRFKSFHDTPAAKAADPLPAEVFMWSGYQKLFGKLQPTKNQSSIGACVAFGTNWASSNTLSCAIAFGGANYEWKDIAEEVTYGGGRQQICHQGGGGDGTNGSCCAKFVQQYGVCPREKVGGYDLSTYSVPTCRSFGDKGAPKAIIDAMAAAGNKVKDITLVKTWADAKVCLANGWGIAVCSNVGFATKRDANGIKVARGNWAHCMALVGYTTINDRVYGYIQNSWGDEEGPVGPGSPGKGGFWAAASTIDRMIKTGGDSWAFSNVVGWEPQRIDWRVQNRNNRNTEPLADQSVIPTFNLLMAGKLR